MRILLTNDDGWDAPGLATLAEAVAVFGEVIIVAPDRHLSGCSHQTTTDRSLELTEVRPGVHHLNGTPADCVRVALGAMELKVDWVLSGINDGGNMGVDVFISGTVAAAREAALMGVPALAISQYRRRPTIDWKRTQLWASQTLEPILTRDTHLNAGEFWNINLPDPMDEREPQVKDSLLEPQQLDIDFRAVPGEEGKVNYVFCGKYHDRRRGNETDVDVCFNGDIAVTRVALGKSFA